MNQIKETIKETITQAMQGVGGLILGVILYVAYNTYSSLILQCIFLIGLYLIGRTWHSNKIIRKAELPSGVKIGNSRKKAS